MSSFAIQLDDDLAPVVLDASDVMITEHDLTFYADKDVVGYFPTTRIISMIRRQPESTSLQQPPSADALAREMARLDFMAMGSDEKVNAADEQYHLPAARRALTALATLQDGAA